MAKRTLLVVHLVLALLVGPWLILYWVLMVVAGEGPFPSPYRMFFLGPMRVSFYLLLQYSIVLGPAAVLSACRFIQLRSDGKRFAGWSSLRPMSNLLATMALLLLAGLLLMDTPWYRIVHTNWVSAVASVFKGAEPIKPPSDEKLEYPSLPLAPEDPYAWSVYDLDGKEVPMAAFRGKAVFLNIWATWCVFCIAEFPYIQRLQDAMKEKNVAFVLVTDEKRDQVKQWVREKGYTLPFYTVPEKFPAMFEPSNYPCTFILAPDGRIAFRHLGCMVWDGERTKAFLTALAEKTNWTPPPAATPSP